MSNAIEIEAKALVSQDDYRKLSKLFPSSPRYTQTNYYIDSDDRILNKEGIALRIREKDGNYELTLKTPLSQGLLEKNAPITKAQFEEFRDHNVFPKGDLVRFLTMLDIDINTLKILTSLTTDRIDVEYEGGLLSALQDCINIMNSLQRVYPSSGELADRLDSAYVELKDISQDLSDQDEEVEFNPERLDEVNNRLNLIYSLQQKHHVASVSELLALADSYAAQLQDITSYDDRMEELKAKRDKQLFEVFRLSKKFMEDPV